MTFYREVVRFFWLNKLLEDVRTQGYISQSLVEAKKQLSRLLVARVDVSIGLGHTDLRKLIEILADTLIVYVCAVFLKEEAIFRSEEPRLWFAFSDDDSVWDEK